MLIDSCASRRPAQRPGNAAPCRTPLAKRPRLRSDLPSVMTYGIALWIPYTAPAPWPASDGAVLRRRADARRTLRVLEQLRPQPRLGSRPREDRLRGPAAAVSAGPERTLYYGDFYPLTPAP